MRRHRKLYLRSFANGVLLAALPVAAFFGADYLLAPPAPGSSTVSSVIASNRSDLAEVTNEQTNAPVSVPPQTRHTAIPAMTDGSLGYRATPGQHVAGSVKSGLVAAIQQELVRVGCYAGEPDGAWSDRTRVAMQAFNTSVHVNLPTGSPDYILLTLLQGHSAKACTRSCETESLRAGSCVDKSIEARAIAPSVAGTPSVAAASGAAPTSWTSTVVLATSGKTTSEILAPSPHKPAVATAAPRTPTVDMRPMVEQPRTDVTAVQPNGSAVRPADEASVIGLDERMAIGILPPPREKIVSPAISRPRADSPARVQAAAPARSPRSTFSDLARTAP